MPFSNNESAIRVVIPTLSRERMEELSNVEVLLYTNDLSYAIKLHRTCMRWCIDFSWQVTDTKSKIKSLDSCDIAVIDCDMGFDEAHHIADTLAEECPDQSILLICSDINRCKEIDWPENIGGTVIKSLGTEKVVEYLVYIANGLHKPDGSS